jgi:hypothetical protein
MIDLSDRLASSDTPYRTFLGLGSALAAEARAPGSTDCSSVWNTAAATSASCCTSRRPPTPTPSGCPSGRVHPPRARAARRVIFAPAVMIAAS